MTERRFPAIDEVRSSGWSGSEQPWPEAGGGCTCWVNPNPFTHYGAVEPGDALAPNPECPMHFGTTGHEPINFINQEGKS